MLPYCSYPISTSSNTSNTSGYSSDGLLLAQEGWCVVLDAKFDKLSKRLELKEAAARVGIPVHFVKLTAPLDLIKARIQTRLSDQRDVSDATFALVVSQLQKFEEFDSKVEKVLTIDTSLPELECEAAIKQFLSYPLPKLN